MYCTKCGTEIPDSAKGLPRCGYPARTRQGERPAANPTGSSAGIRNALLKNIKKV